MIKSFDWDSKAQRLTIEGRDGFRAYQLISILIPMYKAGFIEGFKNGLFEVQKIDCEETEFVDVDGFMIQNVDEVFCHQLLKFL